MIPKLLCAELDGIGCLRFGECHRVVEDFPRIPFDKSARRIAKPVLKWCAEPTRGRLDTG
jgi:hypothetical protein